MASPSIEGLAIFSNVKILIFTTAMSAHALYLHFLKVIGNKDKYSTYYFVYDYQKNLQIQHMEIYIFFFYTH